MTLFADILLAALAVISPRDGAIVPMISADQAAFIARSPEEIVRSIADTAFRARLAAAGAFPQVVKMTWSNAFQSQGRMRISAQGSSVSESFAVPCSGCRVTNLEPGRHYSWTVSFGDENVSASFATADQLPRLLRIDGVANARDLGGWRGLEGRRVRFGRLFRSATLRGADNRRGITHLTGTLGVVTDIELRDVHDPLCLETSALGSQVCWIACSMASYARIDGVAYGREPFAKICRVLASSETYPAILQCDTGCDRTGTVSYLLLGLLGVSRDDALRDWAASAFAYATGSPSASDIRALDGYLKSLGGNSFAERCVRYARGCGVTDAEIAAIRACLLEKGGVR